MARGYYDVDANTWVTAAEAQRLYDEEQERCAVDEDMRRQAEADDHDAGINWLSVAAEITRPATPAATVRPLAPVTPHPTGLLTPHDCLDIADLLSTLRMDPDYAPQGTVTRDVIRTWERQLRAYAITLTDVATARASAERRTA